MSQFLASGGQSIWVSASVSVLPINTQDWFPLVWMVGSPCSPRDSQESSPIPQFKSISSLAPSFENFHMTTGKTEALTRWNFVGKVLSLLFNMLSRLVITFLPRSKRLLISWLQSPPAPTAPSSLPSVLSKTLWSAQNYFPAFTDEKSHLKASERFGRMQRYFRTFCYELCNPFLFCLDWLW